MRTGKGTWKQTIGLTTVTALALCSALSACADTEEPGVSPRHRTDLVAAGGTPPLVTYARESLPVLDELNTINNRLRPLGGIPGRLSTTIRGWLGNSDIDRISMLSADRMIAARRSGDDDPFYLQMAEGTADVPLVPFATNRAFITAARRDAHDIIDRYEFRDRYMATHRTLLGSDAAYRATAHPDGQWTITRID